VRYSSSRSRRTPSSPVGGHVQKVLAEWNVEHEAKTAACLSVRCLREKLVHAVLEPDLAMGRSRVVLEQHEWRPLHLFEVCLQCRQQTGELDLLIEPKADLCPLFVLKALFELTYQGVEDHCFLYASPNSSRTADTMTG
jgi:hypothetical protein